MNKYAIIKIGGNYSGRAVVLFRIDSTFEPDINAKEIVYRNILSPHIQEILQIQCLPSGSNAYSIKSFKQLEDGLYFRDGHPILFLARDELIEFETDDAAKLYFELNYV